VHLVPVTAVRHVRLVRRVVARAVHLVDTRGRGTLEHPELTREGVFTETE